MSNLLEEVANLRSVANVPIDKHFQNPRIQALMNKIVDTGAVDLVVELLEDMERTNMKLLQAAGDYDELITCREFSKVIGMLIKKLKRANGIKKKNLVERKTAALQGAQFEE